jgi:transcriptional antiterminator RfaH
MAKSELPMTPQWYALWVMSNAEFMVEEALAGRGIQAFLPSWSEIVQWSDRKKETTRPLFPGYLFARCADSRVPDIVSIAGVIKILPENLTPLTVDDAEIENVRRLLAAGAGRPMKVCDYVTGDAVTIESGAFAGVKGIVQRTKNGTRVIVKIEILRRAASVEIDADELVKEAA